MERVHLEEVVQEQEDVLGWVELEEEGWWAPGPVRVRLENVCVQNAERLSLTKSGHPVTL
jgi:hypothetical protein